VAVATTPAVLEWGAFAFGVVIGWNAYFVNRYRKSVAVGDLTTIVAAVGAGAILKVFPSQSETFGYYALGLALGFFGYLVFVAVLIRLAGLTRKQWTNWMLFGTRPDGTGGDRPALTDEPRAGFRALLRPDRPPDPPL